MTTSSEQQNLMKKHGITCETKYIYKYKSYRYDDLQQAVNFAIFDQQQIQSSKK
ncbi:hypothetical protein [Marinicella meishanensis]|uniref:hypothetical protein n=1 Tax=Marinicella meishanensis TaxID=2873263 RepID=UPI001CBB57BB|nr:hypothetical protein [Marinicella sp. NBU2979]